MPLDVRLTHSLDSWESDVFIAEAESSGRKDRRPGQRISIRVPPSSGVIAERKPG
jgi:hypothetical protein